jgi:hypothetical protein
MHNQNEGFKTRDFSLLILMAIIVWLWMALR